MCMYLRRFRYMDHSEVSFWPALMRSLFVFLPLKHQGDLPCGFAWREGLSESFFPVLKALLPHSLLQPWPWCLWAWWHCLKNISRKTLAIRARPADVDYVDCFLAWRFFCSWQEIKNNSQNEYHWGSCQRSPANRVGTLPGGTSKGPFDPSNSSCSHQACIAPISTGFGDISE